MSFEQIEHAAAIHLPFGELELGYLAFRLPARDAITHTVITLPEELGRSLTRDQGAEMARHDLIKIDAGSESISATRKAHGSTAPTRTLTGCYVSISRKTQT